MANLFFGREADCKILQDFLFQRSLTVLYASSGIGKTSVIEAGIVPKIRAKGYLPIKIRFTSNNPGKSTGRQQGSETGNLVSIFMDAIVNNLGQNEKELINGFKFADFEYNNFERAWCCLKTLHNRSEKVVLILDQFEEVFTYPRQTTNELLLLISILVNKTLPSRIDSYIRKVIDLFDDNDLRLLYDPINLKILIGIKEDKLSHLNTYSYQLPDLVTNFFQLPAMGSEGAHLAIVEPGKIPLTDAPIILYESGVLATIIKEATDGGELSLTNLQIILQHLEEESKNSEVAQISGKFTVKKEAIGPHIIRDYFEGIFSRIIQSAGTDTTLTDLFINDLIDVKTGLRNQVNHDKIINRIGNNKLRELVDEKRILRKIPLPGRGTDMYELSHESCVQPIIEYARKSEEERLRRKQAMENESIRRKKKRQIGILVSVIIVSVSIAIVFAAQAKKISDQNKQIEKELSNKTRLAVSLNVAYDSLTNIIDSLNNLKDELSVNKYLIFLFNKQKEYLQKNAKNKGWTYLRKKP